MAEFMFQNVVYRATVYRTGCLSKKFVKKAFMIPKRGRGLINFVMKYSGIFGSHILYEFGGVITKSFLKFL